MSRFVKFGGAPYVPGAFTLDGIVGTYLSTPDVNLMDADTAHTYQSRGTYTFGAIVNDSASWSGRMNSFDYPGAGTEFPTILTPVASMSAATEYSSTGLLKALDWSKVNSVQITIQWRDSAGSPISVTNGPVVSNPVSDQIMVVTGISPALTTEAAVYMTIVLNDAVTMRFSDNCIREGADATFTPSLDIVSTLFEDKVDAAMPLGYAADGTPLTLGVLWAGDAVHYRRY
ncbi:unnamed protein product, partial [marine sediment metagenome]